MKKINVENRLVAVLKANDMAVLLSELFYGSDAHFTVGVTTSQVEVSIYLPINDGIVPVCSRDKVIDMFLSYDCDLRSFCDCDNPFLNITYTFVWND